MVSPVQHILYIVVNDSPHPVTVVKIYRAYIDILRFNDEIVVIGILFLRTVRRYPVHLHRSEHLKGESFLHIETFLTDGDV